MSITVIPKDYHSSEKIRDRQKWIKEIKDLFQNGLAKKLNLQRVSAPLFVEKNSGINDLLNGVERPVTFDMLDTDFEVEIVQSLAKWKRFALKEYEFEMHTGIYSDMNAIRRDEILDNIHSSYVDQWDWELIIDASERNLDFLKKIVNLIYSVFLEIEAFLAAEYGWYQPVLPKELYFISSEELLQRYPDLDSKERERQICIEKKAVFIYGIGGNLSNGEPHDGRAPDYDDWDLNGDLLFYYPMLDIALELSSMGIRVDKEALIRQLEIRDAMDRAELPFHKSLIEDQLPLTIGGGIGQSRICMFFLNKAHIGEVQCSVWSDEIRAVCKEAGIRLL